jgi:hypothetical protein
MCKKKTDCFAYTGNGCSALKALYCASEECSFYKNKDVYSEELKKYAVINFENGKTNSAGLYIGGK